MTPMIDVEAALPADSAGIARIYNEGIVSRAATFETSLRDENDIRDWFHDRRIVQVAKSNGRILGFATAYPYRDRECYAGVGEFSVYVDDCSKSKGIGRALMSSLLLVARERGYWKLVSRVFPENVACLSLLRSMGFRQVGTYRNHAQLDGVWRDVVIVERGLLE